MNLLNRLFSDPDDEVFTRTVEKIRAYRERKAVLTEEEEKVAGLKPGQVWLVPDSRVQFRDESKTRTDHDFRPGITGNQEPSEPSRTVQWVPLSTKLKNRQAEVIVYLDPVSEPVDEPCVALIDHFLWFRPKTLTDKKGKLSEGKKHELMEKLAAFVQSYE
ncbi:MAG: hypothetical protein HUU10_12980 [Bacteroidetes bacterium]|nr:hypothetical protein [Bacteroidota bacterium]